MKILRLAMLAAGLLLSLQAGVHATKFLFLAGFSPRALPVDFSQHDVQRANDRNHIGHQQAAHHLVERLQIHE